MVSYNCDRNSKLVVTTKLSNIRKNHNVLLITESKFTIKVLNLKDFELLKLQIYLHGKSYIELLQRLI